MTLLHNDPTEASLPTDAAFSMKRTGDYEAGDDSKDTPLTAVEQPTAVLDPLDARPCRLAAGHLSSTP